MKIIDGILSVIDGVNEVVGRLVSVVAAVFALIIIYDVTMRYVFNSPTRWGFDVTKQLFGFYFIMLGGYALKHSAHVRVDLLLSAMPPLAKRITEGLGYLIFFFPFTWVFATRSWEFALRSWNQGETTYGSVQLPVYPLKMAMFVGACLLLAQGLAEFIKLVLNKEERAYVG